MGYCCPTSGGPSFYGCQPNEEVNRVCSSETEDSEFYFKACMNVNKPENCGHHTDIQVGFSEEEIEAKNILWGTACVWEFWDRINGFKKFGGEMLKFRIEDIANMQVFVAAGDKYEKIETIKKTKDNSWAQKEWIEIDVGERVFIAAMPAYESPSTNKLKFTFV
jgi:hypothetical protein